MIKYYCFEHYVDGQDVFRECFKKENTEIIPIEYKEWLEKHCDQQLKGSDNIIKAEFWSNLWPIGNSVDLFVGKKASSRQIDTKDKETKEKFKNYILKDQYEQI